MTERGGVMGLVVAIVGILAVVAVGAALYLLLITPTQGKLAKALNKVDAKQEQAEKTEVESRKQADRQDALERDVARLRQ